MDREKKLSADLFRLLQRLRQQEQECEEKRKSTKRKTARIWKVCIVARKVVSSVLLKCWKPY